MSSDAYDDGWTASTEFFKKANCQDKPELFFPKRGDNGGLGGIPPGVKEICDKCLVNRECFEYSLTLPAHSVGIYAGISHKLRKSLRQKVNRGLLTVEEAYEQSRNQRTGGHPRSNGSSPEAL